MIEITNGMRGRFIWKMEGRNKPLVIVGNLTTCNSNTNYEGPFTHVTVTRFTGTFLRMRADQIVSFEAIPEGRYS